MTIKDDIEKANREYVSKLKTSNKLVEHKGEYPIHCDRCYKPICKGSTYLSYTLLDKKHGNTEFAYCERCIKDVLSEQEYSKLYSGSKALPNDPKELCQLCLKFCTNKHYNKDQETKPLYDMLQRLFVILSKENKE